MDGNPDTDWLVQSNLNQLGIEMCIRDSASTVITGPDGTVEISVTSQTAGISIVTASINNSSLSRDVTFVADVDVYKRQILV